MYVRTVGDAGPYIAFLFRLPREDMGSSSTTLVLFHRTDDVGEVLDTVLLHHAWEICDDIA